jgi:phosphoribosyl 1,2-cyclic phosphodiesterase
LYKTGVRVTVLASGSAGNALLIESGVDSGREGERGAGERTRVLVDCGLPARVLARRLEKTGSGVRLEDLRAVLCTHEHGDHGGGVPALASGGLPVVTTDGTARALNLTGTVAIAAGARVSVDAVEVTAVALPHDAAEPVGFIVDDGHGTVGVITDCGHPAPEVAAAFAGVDILVLETNHDVDLLRAGAYPAALKRRIASARGHLSNAEAAELLVKMAPPRAQVLILAHLSVENNQPRLARAAVERALAKLGVRPRLLIASADRPTAPVVCTRGKARVLPGMDDRQLRLAFPDPP